jgi:hypothetical protein
VDLNRLFTPCPQEVLFLFLSDPPEEAECELRNYEVHRDHTPYPQAAILAYSYMATVAWFVQHLPTQFDSKHKNLSLNRSMPVLVKHLPQAYSYSTKKRSAFLLQLYCWCTKDLCSFVKNRLLAKMRSCKFCAIRDTKIPKMCAFARNIVETSLF